MLKKCILKSLKNVYWQKGPNFLGLLVFFLTFSIAIDNI